VPPDAADFVDRYLRPFGLPAWVTVLAASMLMAALSVALTAVALVSIPPDYFVGPRPPWHDTGGGAVRRWALRIARNALGWVLIVAGVVLSLPGVPGQGLLTILLGLMLVEFPGKRRLEQRLVRRPGVHRAINRLRARFGRPPLQLDEP
jgi:hypothetical protein